ncbi:MAG: radical SAM protein [Acutalibacteraceae bacterium]|jgi:MoaA/NifB/PqqE/SkfB family radical SAM enzyme
MKVTNKIKKIGVKQALRYLDKDPDKNIPKLMDWVDTFVKDDVFASQRKGIREIINEPDGNWYKYIKSMWSDIDDDVRRHLFESFFLNACLEGWRTQDACREKYQCGIPWAILLDPTSACNLKCIGCWAADYGTSLNMDLKTLDSIITQGKELGTYFYIYSGGEPLVRKKDIITLCEKHPDCTFLSFTNGTLIDEEFADEMLRVKNFVPAISVEGFEKETDFRRGDGTFKAVKNAMDILKSKKLPFGISCCYTSKNVDVIGSEEYFDQMIDWGAKFAWFFTYMPVGVDAVTDLIATDEQREFMYHQIRDFRKTKPLFTLDFWNDGEYVGGCIAGGRRYLHINANGDVEPCAFIHYSDSNIKEKTLIEALQGPLFMQYHNNQPFNNNHLRPCPLLDNPGVLSKMVDDCGAKSTDMMHPEDVHTLSDKCVPAAKKWAVTADKLWQNSNGCANCKSKCTTAVK